MADSAPRTTPEIVMEPRLAALSLFLNQLGVSPTIASMSARKTLQKAVYLGQLSGVDLGYRFGWYLRGPYSTDLAKAYYRLAEAAGSGEQPAGELRASIRQKLAPIRPLMNPPDSVDLERSEWLELLASWHYLRAVRKVDYQRARDVIKTEKAGLLAYIGVADETLQQAGLLAA